MQLSENAVTVLNRRYLKRDEQGNLTETVEQLFERVAHAIAQADLLYDSNCDTAPVEQAFYEMMTNLDFLPNSPTLMNAGRPIGQLSACFVLPIEDSMEAIFEAVKQAALIHKSGGGTGFSFSRLRPNGSAVNSTGGVASGPVSFLRVFNMATEAVKQGGTRRGANMGILRVDHPDILEFIDCKRDNADITNFNLSIGITEAFMRAVEADEEYELINPVHKQAVGTLRARDVFEKIVDSAWRNGEPGIVFLDRLNRDNVVPSMGEIESTNPCGEQPLLPYESCNLGSINLSHMLRREEDGTLSVDYEKLAETVEHAVHFLDNVIDINKYPLEQIDFTTKQTRKIGLGVMGFADMLLLLGIPYDSDEAVELAGKVMKFIDDTAKQQSCLLAKTRGSFPLFGESIYSERFECLRNATVTTIAPTGTLSLLASCSSGVEPVFAYAYIRNVMDSTKMTEVSPILADKLKERGLYTEDLLRKIAEQGTLAHIEEIPEDIRRVFVSAHDISPEYHIRMQAAFQQHIDNAVSKTVNFTQDATHEDVAEVYRLAYRLGCKGVTIYRDKSRDSQVLNIGKVSGEESSGPAHAQPGSLKPRPRPAVTTGFTERMKIGCGNLYVTVNYDENGICEVFTSTGKAGGCPSQSEATARLVSISLRAGLSVDEIAAQLKGIRCPSTIRQQGMNCTSCPDAIARVILKVSEYRKHCQGTPHLGSEPSLGKTAQKKNRIAEDDGHTCPECGAEVQHEGGCVICRSCGYSKCS